MAKGQTPWGRMGLRRWKFFQLRRKEREEQGLAPRPPHREASFEPAVAKRRKKQWQNIKRRGFTDPAPLPAGTRLRTREDAQRAAAAHAEFLGLWPKSACSTELGPDGAGEILDGSAEDSGGTHRWHRDSPCCAGRTTQLQFAICTAGWYALQFCQGPRVANSGMPYVARRQPVQVEQGCIIIFHGALYAHRVVLKEGAPARRMVGWVVAKGSVQPTEEKVSFEEVIV